MMRVLLDTNIILDLLLAREPFVENAALIWQAHEKGLLIGYVSAITPINVFYIGRKLKGREAALAAVRELVGALPVAPVNQTVLEEGLQLGFKDFEDAVQHASASAVGADAIITRNPTDFAEASLSVYSPDMFINKHRELLKTLLPQEPDGS